MPSASTERPCRADVACRARGRPTAGQNVAMTASSLPAGAQRVAAALAAAGHAHDVVMLPVTGRTAQDAADALGIEVGQIAKSIIFRRLADDAPVMVVTSGDRRVDESKVAALVGDLGRADAAFVKAATGFSIGGVSPVGQIGSPVILIDRTLSRYHQIWAAAGHPYAVFPLTLLDLVALTGAPIADVVIAL